MRTHTHTERIAHCEWSHSLAEILVCIHGEGDLSSRSSSSSNIHHSVAGLHDQLLTLGRLDFPTMMDAPSTVNWKFTLKRLWVRVFSQEQEKKLRL